MEAIYNEHSRKSGIYKITNKLNGRFYMGSAKCFKVRRSQHLSLLRKGKHHNIFLQGDFNKRGEEAFVFEVIEVIDGTMEQRILIEQTYLDEHYDNQILCYNLSPFAHRNIEGIKQSQERSKQKSKILKDRWKNDPSYREKMRAANTGRKMPDHVYRALQNVLKGNEHFKGKKHTKETKALMSMVKTGHKVSQERRNHHSKVMTGRKHTKEHIEKIATAHRGKKQTKYQKEQTSKANSKFYDVVLISPDNTEYGPIQNLSKFCRQHNLKHSKLGLVIRQLRPHHKGWRIKSSDY